MKQLLEKLLETTIEVIEDDAVEQVLEEMKPKVVKLNLEDFPEELQENPLLKRLTK